MHSLIRTLFTCTLTSVIHLHRAFFLPNLTSSVPNGRLTSSTSSESVSVLSELWNLEFLRVAPKEVGGRGKGGALGHKMGVASANRDRAESNNSPIGFVSQNTRNCTPQGSDIKGEQRQGSVSHRAACFKPTTACPTWRWSYERSPL